MKPFIIKPISYDARQVALIVRVALYFAPARLQERETAANLDKIAAEMMEPSPAVLEYFGLRVRGEAFVWNPR
jgi:hypothetical protein